MPEGQSRKLAAILAADIAGYSTLMGADEARTVRDLKSHQAVVLPMVGAFGGRIIDTAGDGILAEFASVVSAVECARAIQKTMAERNAAVEPQRRMQFRMGINLGDVIYDEARIYGDGINVAARLEAIAEPGGICISRRAYELVEDRLALAVRELGPQTLKNIARPVEVLAIDLDGTGHANSPKPAALSQEIKYCRAPDGVRLAYASAGRGPPLVKTANWLNHLEYDWECPIFRHIFVGLTENFTLIRYDARGNGLSDWEVDDVSLDAWVRDLETVVDAAGIERFPLLGFSQGCAISIVYALRHPERVSHLVLYGGFARGRYTRATSDLEREKVKAMRTLMLVGWGEENPMFRQIHTHQLIPGATKEQHDAFNELQRRTTSPECAARYFEIVCNIDVTALLRQVTVPTLVVHGRGDEAVPLEEGRRLATGIPGARFVVVPGNNHIPLPQDSTWPRVLDEIKLFLDR